MTPAALLGSPLDVALSQRTPEADARLWLLCTDDRIAAEVEGFDAWTERMRARWRTAWRNGWRVQTTEARERDACRAAWVELVGEVGS